MSGRTRLAAAAVLSLLLALVVAAPASAGLLSSVTSSLKTTLNTTTSTAKSTAQSTKAQTVATSDSATTATQTAIAGASAATQDALTGPTATTQAQYASVETFTASTLASLAGIVTQVSNDVQQAPTAVTAEAGVSTLSNGVSGLLTGTQTALSTGTAAIAGFQAHVDPTIASAIAKLQHRAEAAVAKAGALDPNGATEEVTGAVNDLQGEAMGLVGDLTGVALTEALTNGLLIAQQVLSPTCTLLATPVALAQGVGVDTSGFYPLGSGIQPIDEGTNALLRQTYDSLYDQILNSVNGQLGPAGATAGLLLQLLKFNWTTTYYPPNGGEPVVHVTKSLLDVPTPIDVDGQGGFDLCAMTTLALDAKTGQIKLTQQVSKLPLSKAVLPVDISGALLGVIGFGYETKDSTAPTNFTSEIALGSGPELLTLDNTYTVHRGTVLSVPPELNGLINFGAPATGAPLKLGDQTVLTVPPLTSPAPKPKITQVIGIGGSALQLRFRHEDEPGATHVGVGLTGGMKVRYDGTAKSDLFNFTTKISTLGLGVTTSPAAPVFRSCATGLLGGGGACSTAPDTTGDNASMRFSSSEPTKFDLFQTILGDGKTCPTTLGPALDAHLSGTGFDFGSKKGTTGLKSGRVWLNSDGRPVSGCVSVGTTASNGIVATLPEGFSASKRQSLYHELQTFGFATGFAPDEKTGTIECPSGTDIKTVSSAVLQYTLNPTMCFLPPVNTAAPAITGQAMVDATLTSTTGTWTPAAPNAPTFTRQWLRCNTSGAECLAIPGATNATYALQYGDGVAGSADSDLGHTFKVTVTGTNLDGTATATSAATPVTVLPPAPVNTAKPVVSAVTPPAGVGRALKTTNGTWNNGVLQYHYAWLRCDEDGGNCAEIGAADSAQYTPTADDMGHTITVRVTAVNHGGDVSATSDSRVLVPPPPVNLTAPGIYNGASAASGQAVLTGDSLTAKTGTWKYAASYSYAWQRCDAAGEDCVPIVGASTSSYAVADDDIGHTLRVIVTASNVDGSTPVMTTATGLAAKNDLEVRAPAAVVDGDVSAVAPSDHGTTYVGGSFDTAGTPTGGAGLVPAQTGTLGASPVGAAALTQGGTVKAVAPDGSGGYYLGGTFTRVKGTPCNALAHIGADGSLDPTYCQAGLNGEIRAIDAAFGLVAIGGAFTLGDHANLAFIRSDGSATFADGDPNAAVNALTDDAAGGGSAFYAGGDFATVGATSARRLAKLGVANGAVSVASWNAGVDRTTGNPSVKALGYVRIAGILGTYHVILAGGSFDRALTGTTSTARANAAGFTNAASSTLAGWTPNPNGTVRAIAVANPTPANNGTSAVYLGGDMTQLGNTVLGHVAQFGISSIGAGNGSGTGAASSPTTNYKPAIDNGTVNALALDGTGNVYVGGSFTVAGGQVRHRLAAFKPAGTSGGVTAPEAWDPNAGRTVNALARTGTKLAVGGDFRVLGGQNRLNLAELDPAAGLTGWNPGADGEVRALASTAGGVIAGGTFRNAGGQPRASVAAITSAGALTSWNPGTDGTVDAVAADGSGAVYLGGSFSLAGGAARANAAKVSAEGDVAAWAPDPDGAVHALLLDGDSVLAGGAFANAGGAERRGLARLTGDTGAVSAWSAGLGGDTVDVRSLASSGGVLYLGGAFAEAGGAERRNAAAVDAESGEVTDFAPDPDGRVDAIVPLGSSVFLGGTFAAAGGAVRTNAAQVANDTGEAKSFAPEADAEVRAIAVTGGGGLVLGGKFATIAGALSPGAAFFGGT